jgi:hypothetical protein
MPQSTMTIRLPTDPRSDAYEDFATAYAFAAGYFVETRLKLRDTTVEVLELDVVATSALTKDAKRVLVEAKSGGWGFPDVFKVSGWINFLGIPAGVVIYREEIEQRRKESLDAVSKKTNVSCHRFDLVGKVVESPFNDGRKIDADFGGHILTKAWYSQISQRLVFANFTSYCKSSPGAAFESLIANTIDYQRAAERSFFESDPAARVAALYRAYQRNPNLSGAFVDAMSTAKAVPMQNIWNEANDTKDHLWLQYVMFLEHRARIGIIKAAADLIATGAKEKAKLGAFYEVVLPDSFLSGLEKLAVLPEWEKVPYLFQMLVEVFGGFYRDDEIELLAAATGIAPANIPTALALYQEFFPTGKGWFYTVKGLHRLKLIPAFLRGIGCFFRQSVHKLDRYEAKYPDHSWLYCKWHNVAIVTCGRELAVPEKQALPVAAPAKPASPKALPPAPPKA